MIFVGEFQGFAAARWNTPDGKRPADPAADHALLVRPVQVKLRTVIRGDETDVSRVVMRGGQLGCDRVMFADSQELTVGDSYVYFVVALTDSHGTRGAMLAIHMALPVGKDDMVQTIVEGDIPLSALVREVAAATYEPR